MLQTGETVALAKIYTESWRRFSIGARKTSEIYFQTSPPPLLADDRLASNGLPAKTSETISTGLWMASYGLNRIRMELPLE